MRKPIAIFHRLFDKIGEKTYPCYQMLDVQVYTRITREALRKSPQTFGRRFYIEWTGEQLTKEADRE